MLGRQEFGEHIPNEEGNGRVLLPLTREDGSALPTTASAIRAHLAPDDPLTIRTDVGFPLDGAKLAC